MSVRFKFSRMLGVVYLCSISLQRRQLGHTTAQASFVSYQSVMLPPCGLQDI